MYDVVVKKGHVRYLICWWACYVYGIIFYVNNNRNYLCRLCQMHQVYANRPTLLLHVYDAPTTKVDLALQ